MPKYEVDIEGQSIVVRNYRATLEVEADSEDDAVIKATEKAEKGDVDWKEEESEPGDPQIVVENVEVTSEIEEEGDGVQSQT